VIDGIAEAFYRELADAGQLKAAIARAVNVHGLRVGGAMVKWTKYFFLPNPMKISKSPQVSQITDFTTKKDMS